MLEPGDVILASVQFTDTTEVKVRPAVVLFKELGNVVIAGITSNPKMNGIPLIQKEGAVKDSVIKQLSSRFQRKWRAKSSSA
jgi:mRNA interferase MazF